MSVSSNDKPNIVQVSEDNLTVTVISSVGPSGVIAVTAPITNSGTSTSANIGINQSGITVAQSQVTGLVSDLAAKLSTTTAASTYETISNVALKAPLASPTFTGTPAAPTATAGTNTTQVATTAFVTTADNLKANLASPTFTGTPTLPTGTIAVTQTAGNSTTAVATTAFVTTANQLLGTYTAYTPTLSGITIGNGTIDAKYCRVNDFVHVIGRIVLGSTSSVTGTSYLTLPVNCDAIQSPDTGSLGDMYFVDASAGSVYPSNGITSGSLAGRAYISALFASGTYLSRGNISATVPFTWATGDSISFNFYYKAA